MLYSCLIYHLSAIWLYSLIGCFWVQKKEPPSWKREAVGSKLVTKWDIYITIAYDTVKCLHVNRFFSGSQKNFFKFFRWLWDRIGWKR